MCHWAIVLILEIIKPHMRLYHGAPSLAKPHNALCLSTLQCQPPLVATALDSKSSHIVQQIYNTNSIIDFFRGMYLGKWRLIFGGCQM